VHRASPANCGHAQNLARLVAIVRDQLNALLPEPLEDVLEREARQRMRIAAKLNGGR